MRALYDEIVRDGWGGLLARRGTPEGPHLEAKEKADRATAILAEGDAANIAKAICGLANADGGVFLFGVRAREQDGIDRIQNIEPIANVADCLRRVERMIPHMIEPPIVDLHIERIEEPNGNGSGVVVVYAGASDAGPHRIAGGVEQGRYYLRTGSRTAIMPHTILADRFGRRPHPRLRLVADFQRGDGQRGLDWGISLRLRNEGRGVAHRPAVIIRDPRSGLDWRTNLPLDMALWRVMYGSGNYRPNHCGWRSESGALVYPETDLYVTHVGHGNASGGVTEVTLTGAIYCEDAPPHEFAGIVRLGEGETIL